MKNRAIPFERMIYFGDGDTDNPTMKMVSYQGGNSISVFNPEDWKDPRNKDKVSRLIAEKRVTYVAPGDYRKGELLDTTVKGILGMYARDADLHEC